MHKTAFVLLLVISNIARILSGGSNDVHKVETTAGFTCDGGTPKRCHYPSSCNCSKQELEEGDTSSTGRWYFDSDKKTCNVSTKSLDGCNKFDTKGNCKWYCLRVLE
nr:uncharacterized protein LOC119185527 isoform X1 [Rhipicephalus microplus]XP_037290688.1 uncharacterized protein LOC119185991 isoform X1 [Rhipicephalus microplus]